MKTGIRAQLLGFRFFVHAAVSGDNDCIDIFLTLLYAFYEQVHKKHEVAMPKLIPEAERSILAAAKKQLFEKGYANLAIREVAGQCGIAVGTIYNYFPGKEALVAAVMAEDWRNAMAGLRESFARSAGILEGIVAMYNTIEAFSKLYAPAWSQYGSAPASFGERHLMLRGQLSALLEELVTRHGREEDAALCPLLAETVLACATHADLSLNALSTAVSRLFL